VLAVRTAASVANSFAIDVSVVDGLPWSFSTPARQASPRAASMSTTMSAIIACTSWKEAIGLPNCSRSFAYDTLASMQPCITPTQPHETE
jgi:hypothetical protein